MRFKAFGGRRLCPIAVGFGGAGAAPVSCHSQPEPFSACLFGHGGPLQGVASRPCRQSARKDGLREVKAMAISCPESLMSFSRTEGVAPCPGPFIETFAASADACEMAYEEVEPLGEDGGASSPAVL